MAIRINQLVLGLIVATLALLNTACKEEVVDEVATAGDSETVEVSKARSSTMKPVKKWGYTFLNPDCVTDDPQFVCSTFEEPVTLERAAVSSKSFEWFLAHNALPADTNPKSMTRSNHFYAVALSYSDSVASLQN